MHIFLKTTLHTLIIAVIVANNSPDFFVHSWSQLIEPLCKLIRKLNVLLANVWFVGANKVRDSTVKGLRVCFQRI